MPEVPHQTAPEVHGASHDSSRFRYCTNFVVRGELLEPREFVQMLEGLGDSVLVVGDEGTLRVHVHTDEPESAVAVFAGATTVERLDVADMHEQEDQRAARLRGDGASGAPVRVRCGVVAVVSGEGIRCLYEELGAHVVEGGPTLNPSTFELLAGIHEVPADEVIVLPNSPNVVMAAERAAELSEKSVAVVETSWPQAGLAALVEHEPALDLERNAQRLRGALASIRAGAVAPAARDDKKGRFSTGDAVGFVEDEIVSWGQPEAALGGVLERLARGSELLTLLAGDGAPLNEQEVAQLAPGEIEVETHLGGQTHYWWLIAAE